MKKGIDQKFISSLVRKKYKSSPGYLLNQTLYNLCNKKSGYTFIQQVIAKTEIIGRTYAVALERRSGKSINNDNFYEKIVVEVFKRYTIPKNCKSKIPSERFKYCIQEHWKLIKLLKQLSRERLKKSSFAAKYL